MQSQKRKPKITINRRQQSAQYFVEQLDKRVSMEMMLILGGEFIMGAPETELDSEDSERPQHKVTVPTFFMGKYPVTQEQWRVVAGFPQINHELKPNPSEFKGNKKPVEQVNWYEAKEFCQRLSRHTGREYSLPSEAEWEYACRSVISNQLSVTSRQLTVEEWNEKYNQPFHFGATITTDLANYNGNFIYGEGETGKNRRETTPVDQFGIANDFGLCDMHGNVWEWCEDHWHDNYQNAPTDGSSWTTNGDSSLRVIHGGSWVNNPNNCRSDARGINYPENAFNNIGFRVVCRVPRTP
ncbi:MAG: formylglycine-generating enzyme family protein [Xenococcaceae cyanobacterium MO_207.B15]|nr:formylglycine-generating enzyme family protein [Xenococcaceae cyanobacterium MO_207.B15]